jgi:hypothetical protein
MPSNWADYTQPQDALDQLRLVWRPLLNDVQTNVTAMEAAADVLQQQLIIASDVAASFDSRRAALEQSLAEATTTLVSVSSAIMGVAARVDATSLLLEAEFDGFVGMWLNMTLNFLTAAAQESVSGMAEYQDAINDIGRALHSSTWTLIAHRDRMADEIMQGMQALSTAVGDLIAAGVNAALALEYSQSLLLLEQVCECEHRWSLCA